VQIDKKTVMDYLKAQGDGTRIDEADSTLPDTIDTERDRGVLDAYGIDLERLLSTFGQDRGGIFGR
jgi:hypothetical protein